MQAQALGIYVTLLVCLLAAGCSQQDPLADLAEQSPFKTNRPTPTEDVSLVICQFYPLQLPREVDITQSSFWLQQAGSGVKPEGPKESGSSLGFSAEQLRLWRYNGLHVVVAPFSAWPQFREQLVRAGGLAMPQRTSLLRNPWEVAEFRLRWLAEPGTLFLLDQDGTSRSYALPIGDCVLSVSCLLGPSDLPEATLHVRIVPEFHHARQQERFERDQFGRYQRVTKKSRVVFDQLALSGWLGPDYFIAIAAKPAENLAGSLGRVFLSRSDEAKNYQLLVVLVPALTSGQQIKNLLRLW